MLHWTPKSFLDLREIRRYIESKFSRELAFTKVDEIIDFTETTLNKNPLAGKILESNPLFSVLVYEGNSIFYCEHPQSKELYVVYVQPRRTRLDHERLTTDEVA